MQSSMKNKIPNLKQQVTNKTQNSITNDQNTQLGWTTIVILSFFTSKIAVDTNVGGL
jgi:hypothetical protein